MADRETLPYRPCVGVLLFNAQREVFVGKRIDMVQEAWQMPQGGIDKGEEPREAALRELEEETGVAPHLVELLAETQEWLRYDLPPKMVRRVWRGALPGPGAEVVRRALPRHRCRHRHLGGASRVQRLALVAGRSAHPERGAVQAGALRSGD